MGIFYATEKGKVEIKFEGGFYLYGGEKMTDKQLMKYRKQYKNQKVLNRDREVFKAFSKVHLMNKEHFSRMSFSKKSLDRYEKTGVIERVEYFDKSSQSSQQYFKLTDYGKGWINRNVFNEKQSFYSSRGINHDLRMADIYTKLYEDKVDFEWKAENQLQQEFNQRMEQIKAQDITRYSELQEQQFSASDFSITIDGRTEYIEVITNSGSYTESHLEAKENFATVMNTTVQFIR